MAVGSQFLILKILWATSSKCLEVMFSINFDDLKIYLIMFDLHRVKLFFVNLTHSQTV